MNNNYLQVSGRPSCGRKITAMVADYAIDVNIGFKKFMIAVDSYAVTNHL